MIRSSSKQVYTDDIKPMKEFKQSEIVANYVKGKSVTRRMIAQGLGLETGTVAARVNKLLKDNILVESEDKKPCPITGKRVYWVSCKSDGQLSLI